MPEIGVIAGPLQPGVPETYYPMLAGTIVQAQFPGHPQPELNGFQPETLKLANTDELPRITPVLQLRFDCFFDILHKEYPMLPGEFVRSERFSILAKKTGKLEKGTIVFERISNMATIYFVLLNIGMDEEGLVFVRETELREIKSKTPVFLLKGGKGSFVMKLVKNIFSAAASKAGGALYDIVKGMIFGGDEGGIPDYFDEVYAELTRIVSQKIDDNTIRTINGAINNIIQRIRHEYEPMKKESDLNDKNDRDKLCGLLNRYDDVFLGGASGMLNTLRDPQLAHAGLPVFMLGVGVQIFLLQEKALVDNSNYDKQKKEWKSPLESIYGRPETGTIAGLLREFADHAERTWKEVIAKRRERVQALKFSVAEGGGMTLTGGMLTVPEHRVCITDGGARVSIEAVIGKDDKHGNNGNYDKFLAEKVRPYADKMEEELTKKMEYPAEIIKQWRQMIKQPVKV